MCTGWHTLLVHKSLSRWSPTHVRWWSCVCVRRRITVGTTVQQPQQQQQPSVPSSRLLTAYRRYGTIPVQSRSTDQVSLQWDSPLILSQTHRRRLHACRQSPRQLKRSRRRRAVSACYHYYTTDCSSLTHQTALSAVDIHTGGGTALIATVPSYRYCHTADLLPLSITTHVASSSLFKSRIHDYVTVGLTIDVDLVWVYKSGLSDVAYLISLQTLCWEL